MFNLDGRLTKIPGFSTPETKEVIGVKTAKCVTNIQFGVVRSWGFLVTARRLSWKSVTKKVGQDRRQLVKIVEHQIDHSNTIIQSCHQ